MGEICVPAKRGLEPEPETFLLSPSLLSSWSYSGPGGIRDLTRTRTRIDDQEEVVSTLCSLTTSGDRTSATGLHTTPGVLPLSYGVSPRSMQRKHRVWI